MAFLHAWSKKQYDLNRTIMINRPKAEVYAYIRQLKKQPHWIPWLLKNPGINIKFKGDDGKLAATSYWKASKGIGEGFQKITKVKEGKVVEFQLLFLKPYKFLALSYMAVKEVEPEQTKMVWGIRGIHKFPASVIMLIYGMNRALGKDFEKGLLNIKSNLEKKEKVF